MSARKRLILITQGSPFADNDGRALAVVQGMERALPGLHLEWTVTEGRRLAAVPRRDEWLANATQDERLPFLCNADERYPVMISGLQKSAILGPGGQPLFEVHAKLPLDAAGLSAAAEVLEAVAEGAQAHWGHASPEGYGSEVSAQMRRSAHGPERSPRGLPMLKLPRHIHSPDIPHYLGWLNYWSAAAARAIGFPEPARDAELLSRARRTASGGWVVQLTDAPLDYNNPAHLDTLKRIYERFPQIGGRSAP
ncbi:DUF5953 family protein [Myxococcus sp. SDU36]|uniref:DUF5953 family protein n=1 Tax=Myxococcus sp. SDU36 TaxID=2831967 RepID=UPI002543965E|nr:DUF5953 family protein [Myxococcus sp. SDU36]WIG94890.1 hypothetical protein KGD87_30995 [Myxococcus sp. SDU36]